MRTPRAGHTATILTNGKVLVAGGVQEIAFGIGSADASLANGVAVDPQLCAVRAGIAKRTILANYPLAHLWDG